MGDCQRFADAFDAYFELAVLEPSSPVGPFLVAFANADVVAAVAFASDAADFSLQLPSRVALPAPSLASD